jgi:hypothetical protein
LSADETSATFDFIGITRFAGSGNLDFWSSFTPGEQMNLLSMADLDALIEL